MESAKEESIIILIQHKKNMAKQCMQSKSKYQSTAETRSLHIVHECSCGPGLQDTPRRVTT